MKQAKDVAKEQAKPVSKKTFIVKMSANFGSNKDGSPKVVYKKGEEVKLTEDQEIILRKENII